MIDFTLPDEILKVYSQDILSTKSLINKDIPHTINLANVINKLDFIHKAVVISGFISLKYEAKTLAKLSTFANEILKYEKKTNPDFTVEETFKAIDKDFMQGLKNKNKM